MDEQKEKRIDESWKEAVEKEKLAPAEQGEEAAQIPEVNFNNFVTSISLQALISLGEIESPFTSKKEKNLKQARFLIDTLDMLKEKTAGNLNQEEAKLVETLIYELKMKYVEASKEGESDR